MTTPQISLDGVLPQSGTARFLISPAPVSVFDRRHGGGKCSFFS
jgi:hypothetical protein